MNKQAARYSKTFREVSKIVLPSPCLNKAYKQMRLAAMQGQQGLALFAGVEANNIFKIRQTIIPGQGGLTLADGKRPVVPEEEWQRIRAFLQENEYELIAQIHSNPRQVYQACPNEASSLIQIIGGISIFVPDFTLGLSSPETWAVYRLASDNKWIELDRNEICHLFQISY